MAPTPCDTRELFSISPSIRDQQYKRLTATNVVWEVVELGETVKVRSFIYHYITRIRADPQGSTVLVIHDLPKSYPSDPLDDPIGHKTKTKNKDPYGKVVRYLSVHQKIATKIRRRG